LKVAAESGTGSVGFRVSSSQNNGAWESVRKGQVSAAIEMDLRDLHKDIRLLFTTDKPELKQISDYYFDGSGKSIRPLLICSMSRLLNRHFYLTHKQAVCHVDMQLMEGEALLDSQRKIALIAEMIHVASLVHDDIIDNSDLRRGKASVNAKWGLTKAALAGDYILAVASRALAQLGNNRVVETLSKVLEDLVKGELMQFGTKEGDNERFEHYTIKTYRKTASLIANSCKAVAILLCDNNRKQSSAVSSESEQTLVDMSFECGKNIGIAFQLIDDLLDFTSHSDKLGKPGHGADLRLGLATAPVLFAAAKYPQLNAMIMRRFSGENDVTKAFEFVLNSDGIKETRYLASKYCENAENIINKFKPTPESDYLKYVLRSVISREK
jgi:decaprenyl-diphosphate synthase subunit 1